MSNLVRYYKDNSHDPLWWACAVGSAVAIFLLALMPLAVLEFGSGSTGSLPCPAAFHDDRCTSVLPHLGPAP